MSSKLQKSTMYLALVILLCFAFPAMADNFFTQTMKKAKKGNPEAQYNLGNLYYVGSNGAKEDKAEAAKWYRKAAERGYADAQEALGDMYDSGTGVKQDKAEAVKWWRKAAEHGNEMAQISLGHAYNFGSGVAQDKAAATKWYRKAAEGGSELAQFYLGKAYADGEGVNRDYAEAVKWLRKSAEKGFKDAKPVLEAVLKRQGAEHGDAATQFETGAKYARDYNYIEAARWYRKAAEQGHAEAQSELGYLLYDGGFGLGKNEPEAVQWWRKAAEQGNASAQSNLGNMYYNGKGVKQDKAEAFKWWRKAAERGIVSAQFYTGLSYYYGSGVKKNQKEGLKWWDKAAKQGNKAAANAIESHRQAEAKSKSQAAVRKSQQEMSDFASALYFISSVIDIFNGKPVGTTIPTYNAPTYGQGGAAPASMSVPNNDGTYDVPALYAPGVARLVLIEKEQSSRGFMSYSYIGDLSREKTPAAQYIQMLSASPGLIMTRHFDKEYHAFEGGRVRTETWAFAYSGAKRASAFREQWYPPRESSRKKSDRISYDCHLQVTMVRNEPENSTKFTIHLANGLSYAGDAAAVQDGGTRYQSPKLPGRTKQRFLCNKCHGDGTVKCNVCNGQKGRWHTDNSIPNYSGSTKGPKVARTWVSCSTCGGSGRVICDDCKGTGHMEI